MATRIINGRPVQLNQHPWMVSILNSRESGKNGMCGGTLINDLYILTAAHCLNSNIDVSKMVVTLGSHTLEDRYQTSNVQVESLHLHPEYNPAGEINDIALIRLRDRVIFNDIVRPICLTDSTEYEHLFVTGWGLVSNGYNPYSGVMLHDSEVLREVEVSKVDMSTCSSHFSNVDVTKDICAGGKDGGTCLGDSGGPLSMRKDGRVYQVGVTSFGAADCGVASNAPNVFERIEPHLHWIKQFTNFTNKCHKNY